MKISNHNSLRQSPSYRADVQGLRAIAVLLVMGFHADLPLVGGFLGVDVFFVISGFVITTLLIREYATSGRISWTTFFVRRVKRLGPALSTMLVVVLVLSLFLLSPLGLQQNAALTALGASLLSANAVILAISGGYFDLPAETNPLLNTWSLSVEEQFYLFFPLLWLLALAVVKNVSLRVKLAVGVTSVSLISFIFMLLWSAGLQFPGADTLLGFYGPASRAWEFGLGALVALVPHTLFRRIPVKAASVIALLGFTGLLLPALLLNSSTIWPGGWTLVPTLSTSAIIAAGHVANPVSRYLFSSTIFQRIGDLSYSLYLWHWPLIVLSTLILPTHPTVAIWAAILSIVPAVMSYRFVENPLRSQPLATWGKRISLLSVVTLAPVLVAFGVKTIADHYLGPRLSAGEVREYFTGDLGGAAYKEALNEFFLCPESFLEIISDDPRLTCHQSKASNDVEIALLGDSHALRLFFGVAEAAPLKNVGYFSHGGMQPVAESSQKMSEIIEYVSSSEKIETVIISAWWNLYEVDKEGLEGTVLSLTSQGKTVFLLDDVPEFSFDAFRCKYGVGGIIRMNPICEEPAERNRQLRSKYLPVLEQVAGRPGVILVPIFQNFCSETVCSMVKDGQILYQDSHHLNITGSSWVVAEASANNEKLREALKH